MTNTSVQKYQKRKEKEKWIFWTMKQSTVQKYQKRNIDLLDNEIRVQFKNVKQKKYRSSRQLNRIQFKNVKKKKKNRLPDNEIK